MSQALARTSAGELADITTRFAWRQWQAIGGSAAARAPWRSIVDPEALILVSLFLRDREPRLTDILYSWVEVNADLLSVQRLKNLQKTYPPAVQARVSDFARKTRAISRHPRWRTLDEDPSLDAPLRLPAVRRATHPPTRQPTNLMLRLRLALGVGTKADVLALALGTGAPVTVREIAEALAYTLVGVRLAVSDLASAGFLIAAGGKPAAFAAPHRDWGALLHLRYQPKWVPWHHWFSLVVDLVTWADTTTENRLSEYAFDVKLRELISRHPLFFRFAAHELGAPAFTMDVGTYPEILGSLIEWARHEDHD